MAGERFLRGGPPRYAQLAAALREDIISGRLGAGSRFPSGPDIEAEYGVSHYTAERAVGMLVSEGLIERRSGSGTFVADHAMGMVAVEVGPGTRIRARTARGDDRIGRPGVPVLIVERPGREAEPFASDVTVIVVRELPGPQPVAARQPPRGVDGAAGSGLLAVVQRHVRVIPPE